MKKLPDGSLIAISGLGRDQTITIPFARNGSSYFGGLFLLLWLGGWAFGEITVIGQLLSGNAGGAGLFLLVWLALWTFGGVMAMLHLVRIFRGPVAETIAMTPNGLTRDSGVPSVDQAQMRSHPWKSIFGDRTITSIDRRALDTLTLREFPGGNRLTVDVGAQRLEIGTGASDVEREWLFDVLAERYRLAPANPGSEQLPKDRGV